MLEDIGSYGSVKRYIIWHLNHINLTEDKAAIEIWLRNAENENLCYYFFPYDAAIIEV